MLHQLWSQTFASEKSKHIVNSRSLVPSESLLDKWGIIANHVAVQSAGLALQRDTDDVHQMTQAIRDFNQKECTALKEVLSYYLELNKYRIKYNQQKNR